MMEHSQLVHTGLWRWVQNTGLERFELVRRGTEWILRGTILTLSTQGPAEARYELACSDSWHTLRANISVIDAGGIRELLITAGSGRWYANGVENTSVYGAVDIDLGWSPSTNTLPICRLQLSPGQSSGPLIAAWVSFPDLKLQPLPQEYLCLSDRLYRYLSRDGSFMADLSVDQHSLVIDYQGFWQRVTA